MRQYIAHAKSLLAIINRSKIDKAVHEDWAKLHRAESDLKDVFVLAVAARRLDSSQVKEISKILTRIINSEHPRP